MSGKEYEEVVTRLVQKLRDTVPAVQGGTIGSGARNHVAGASGYDHQIDISATAAAALLLIECKCLSRKVETIDTLAFAARCSDIGDVPGQKEVIGAIATIIGYDPGAQTLASHFGIHLWHVKNEDEFVARIGQVVSAGVRDHFGMSDRVTAEVVRAPQPPE